MPALRAAPATVASHLASLAGWLGPSGLFRRLGSGGGAYHPGNVAMMLR